MATRTKTVEKATVAGGDARIEEYLDSKGITYVFRANVPTSEFDVERSMRNQVRFEPVDPNVVEEYAEAMKRGDVFPPNVAYKVNDKFVNTDGNHRMQAAIKAKKPLSGVYDISGAEANVITLVAFELNTKHGKPTSEAERIQHGLYLMETGATATQAAAAVNLPKRILDKAVQRQTTDARFTENGIALLVIEQLKDTVRWRLAQISTDEGFKAAVALAAAAKLSMDQVFDLVTRVNTVRSSTKQEEMIKDIRADMLGDIQKAGGGTFGAKNNGKGVMGPRSRVGIALSNLEALSADIDVMAKQWVGEDREKVAQRAREGAKRLNALARALSA